MVNLARPQYQYCNNCKKRTQWWLGVCTTCGKS